MTPRLPCLVSLLVLAVCVGCASVDPKRAATPPPRPPGAFSHAELDAVQARFVDGDGRVDYAGLVQAPDALERYYALLGSTSPDTDSALFPDDASRLAYWINAYNASVLKIVKDHYPLSSVDDVRSPAALFFVPGKVRFFLLHRVSLGGVRTSLYQLENGVVRSRHADPRIHFALNCASLACPKLPQRAFHPQTLDADLEREARRFVAEPRNVEIDDTARAIRLSSIFDWYERDFTGWVAKISGGSERGLLDAIARWMPPDRAVALRERAQTHRLVFVPFDWRLNDQATGSGKGP